VQLGDHREPEGAAHHTMGNAQSGECAGVSCVGGRAGARAREWGEAPFDADNLSHHRVHSCPPYANFEDTLCVRLSPLPRILYRYAKC